MVSPHGCNPKALEILAPCRFFDELDYVHEGQNATKFAEQMKDDLPQVRRGGGG